MDIYVGNIHYDLNEDAIWKIFEVFGIVINVVIVKDKVKHTSLGYGFVQMQNAIEADRAIDELDGLSLAGRNLVVNSTRENNKPENSVLPTREEEFIVSKKLKVDGHNNKIYSESGSTSGENDISFANKYKNKDTNKMNYSKTITDDGYVRVCFGK